MEKAGTERHRGGIVPLTFNILLLAEMLQHYLAAGTLLGSGSLLGLNMLKLTLDYNKNNYSTKKLKY